MNGKPPNLSPGPECCINCKFSHPISPQQALCRRMPPTPTVVMVPEGQPSAGNVMIRGIYAPCEPGNWCGEYRRALAVATPADVANLIGGSR